MLLIDRNKPFQTFILTLTESTSIDNPSYLMVIKNDATRDEFTLSLGENVSTGIERYDLFILDTDVFKDLLGGYYSFLVYQSSAEDNAIEEGKLLIRDTTIVAKEDTYIIYDLD